jgi:hypothetical protein
MEQSCSPDSAGKQKEEEEVGGLTIFFKGTVSMTRRPPTRLHLLKVPPLPTSAKLGTKSSTHRPLRVRILTIEAL